MPTIRQTSVTLRASTCRQLRSAAAKCAESGKTRSMQCLLRECLMFCLKTWRVQAKMHRGNRIYNHKAGPYIIVPLYWHENLRGTTAALSHFSGISVSRVVDFAINCYLERILDRYLGQRQVRPWFAGGAMSRTRLRKIIPTMRVIHDCMTLASGRGHLYFYEKMRLHKVVKLQV
jgi:hypothetical protein